MSVKTDYDIQEIKSLLMEVRERLAAYDARMKRMEQKIANVDQIRQERLENPWSYSDYDKDLEERTAKPQYPFDITNAASRYSIGE